MFETSLDGFSRCWRLFLGFLQCWGLLKIFGVPETYSGDFHCVEYFFGGIFKMLGTSSGFFTVLEISSGEYHGAGDFWDFHDAGRLFWRLLWRNFHGAGDFFLDFDGAGDFFGWIFRVLETSLEGVSRGWRLLLENNTVLATSLEGFSRCWTSSGDLKVCESTLMCLIGGGTTPTHDPPTPLY